MKKAISLFILLAMLSASFFFTSANAISDFNSDKISEELFEKIKSSDGNDLIPVYIWLEDIDHSEIDQTVYEKTGLTQEYFEQDHFKNDNPVPKDLGEEEMKEAFLQRYEETEELRQKLDEEVELYIAEKRLAYSETYSSKNIRVLEELKLTGDKILFLSQYSPMNICELTISQIKNAVENPEVNYLDLFVDVPFENCSSTSVVQTIKADVTRDTYGLNGTNIKIGQTESVTVDTSYSGLGGKAFVIGPANTGMHATDVAMTMHTVAPNATIYSIMSYGPTMSYSSIETLITNGVSIINQSAGGAYGDRTNFYTNRERWLDHISPTHEITFCVASGNTFNNYDSYDIIDSGLAYNVITVGATNDANTGNIENDDTIADYTCTANGGAAGCAKPDVVAPGNEYGYYGTSYATPLVSGMAAQMMQYDPTLKTRARAVKAIVTASCLRKVNGTNETMEQGFTWAQGAGLVNAVNMRYILTNNQYSSGYFAGNELSLTTPLVPHFNIAANWVNLVTVDHSTQTPSNASIKDLNMFLYKSNGTEVGASALPNSSVEMIYNSHLSGTFTIKLKKAIPDSEAVWYGIAWY